MRRLTATSLVLSLVALGVPFFVVAIPPVVDFPNHLARMWLISGGVRQPPLDAMYAVEWSRAVTNIGIDVVAGLLGPAIGADVLARVMLALSLLVPVMGGLALAYAVSGRLHPLMLAIPLWAWHTCFNLGFMNQQIAVGLALLAAVAERFLPSSVGRIGLRVMAALLIAIIHPFGAVAHAATLTGLALGPGLRWWSRLPQAALAASIPVLTTAALLFASAAPKFTNGGEGPRGTLQWIGAVGKIGTALSYFVSYFPAVESLCGIGFLGALLLAIRRGAIKRHHGLAVVAGSLALLALIAPSRIGSTMQVDIRFATLAGLLFVSALTPVVTSFSLRWGGVAAMLGLAAVLRTAAITATWLEARNDLRSIAVALEAVPPGARILVALEPAQQFEWFPKNPWRSAGFQSTALHYGALAVPWRRSFTPLVFSEAGKQPLRVLPPYDRLSIPGGGLPPLVALDDPDAPKVPEFGYLRQWRRDFDFVLQINAEAGVLIPPGLDLTRDEGFARLFRVPRDQSRGAVTPPP
ncbi:hypothetical protein [Neoroseomonas oryzicola]|uniref:Uncharacterized protein n=1 Tax=Neoroseomonas oryzicola TaxID=535904 RepID=A0A9X9WL02_9PROT|nr:hypothetical protein [Neoroseomonas oryzicola]MBR0661012.1 hypothetical protein [Neoroseomonas oryzicola]NKE19197.1 hypothetical protein [Neoroseomonas oryzicola]